MSDRLYTPDIAGSVASSPRWEVSSTFWYARLIILIKLIMIRGQTCTSFVLIRTYLTGLRIS